MIPRHRSHRDSSGRQQVARNAKKKNKNLDLTRPTSNFSSEEQKYFRSPFSTNIRDDERDQQESTFISTGDMNKIEFVEPVLNRLRVGNEKGVSVSISRGHLPRAKTTSKTFRRAQTLNNDSPSIEMIAKFAVEKDR